MARVKPFRGLRPHPEKVARVASPPYDVLSSDEAKVKAQNNPISFLHVIKPEIDLDPTIDLHDPRVYSKGAENLHNLIEKGILIQDKEPCFYIYKLRMGLYEQIGLVAVAAVEDYLHNRIKKHENTRPDKEQDRMKHIDHLNAQTGPVFLTYRAESSIDALIKRAMDRDPVYDFEGDYQVKHTFYVIDEPNLIDQLKEAFEKIETLYVADGHHRSAAAVHVQKLRKDKNPHHTGEEAYNYFLTVIFPHNQMHILDYNRVVKDLHGQSVDDFLSQISQSFVVEKHQSETCCGERQFKPQEAHTFGMYLEGQWYCLKAQKGTFNEENPISRLDVAILQENILSPILDIKNPRTDKRIQFVGGIRGLEELERLVDNGQFAVAFSLYPTRIEDLFDVADANEVMPPKSTWFEPKLRSGMVIHCID
jgi:uncharacterized protein (DUF1015 family)